MHSLNVMHAAAAGPAGVLIPDTFVFRPDGAVSHCLVYNVTTQRIDSTLWPSDMEDPVERRADQRRRVLAHLLRRSGAACDIVAVLQRPVKAAGGTGGAGGGPKPTTVDYLNGTRLTLFLSAPSSQGDPDGAPVDEACLLSAFVHPRDDVFSLVYCVYQGHRLLTAEWRACSNALGDTALPVRHRTWTTAAPLPSAGAEPPVVLSHTRPMVAGCEHRLAAICQSIADGYGTGWRRQRSRLGLYFVPVRNPGLAGVAQYCLLAASEAPADATARLPSGIEDEDVSWAAPTTAGAGGGAAAKPAMATAGRHALVQDPKHWTFTRTYERRPKGGPPTAAAGPAPLLRTVVPRASRSQSDHDVARSKGRTPWQGYERGTYDLLDAVAPAGPPGSAARPPGDGLAEPPAVPYLEIEDYVLSQRSGSMAGYLVTPPFLASHVDSGIPTEQLVEEVNAVCKTSSLYRPVTIDGVDRKHAVAPVERFVGCDSTKLLRQYEEALQASSAIVFSEAKEWEARRLHVALIPEDQSDEFRHFRREMERFVPAVRRSFVEKLFAERVRPPLEQSVNVSKNEQNMRKKDLAELTAILQRYSTETSTSDVNHQMSQSAMSLSVTSPLGSDKGHLHTGAALRSLVETLFTKIQDMVYEIYAAETTSLGVPLPKDQQPPALVKDLTCTEAAEVTEWLALNGVQASFPHAALADGVDVSTGGSFTDKGSSFTDKGSSFTDKGSVDAPAMPRVDVTAHVPAKYAAVAQLTSRLEAQCALFCARADGIATDDDMRAFRKKVRHSAAKSAIRALAFMCKVST